MNKKSLNGLRFVDETTIEDKKELIYDLEKNLNLFAYQADIKDLILETKIVNAFILSLAGKSLICETNIETPDWCGADFVIPSF